MPFEIALLFPDSGNSVLRLKVGETCARLLGSCAFRVCARQRVLFQDWESMADSVPGATRDEQALRYEVLRRLFSRA